MNRHLVAARALVVVVSLAAGIDFLGIFLLSRAIFGPTLRPLVALLFVFAMRRAAQLLCALPPPDGMIWRNPGFPSLLVTYGVASDFFFSGHTAIAVLGAAELARESRRCAALGISLASFEAGTVLFLRAHYTMDVLAAVSAATASPLKSGSPPFAGLSRRGRTDDLTV